MINDINSNEENNSQQNIKITLSSSINSLPEKDAFIPVQVEQYLSVTKKFFFNF